MALAHCILGTFLGVVCHCFPPPLDVPTFAAKFLYARNDARDPSSERWNCGREIVREFCLNSDFHLNLGIFYMPQIYDMGPIALLPLRRKACWGFFRPKNPTAWAGFEPANLGTKGQHATPRPPKPLDINKITLLHQVGISHYFMKEVFSLTLWPINSCSALNQNCNALFSLFCSNAVQHETFICSGTYESLFLLGKMSTSKILLGFSLSLGV